MQHLPQVSEHETRRSPLGCPNSHTATSQMWIPPGLNVETNVEPLRSRRSGVVAHRPLRPLVHLSQISGPVRSFFLFFPVLGGFLLPVGVLWEVLGALGGFGVAVWVVRARQSRQWGVTVGAAGAGRVPSRAVPVRRGCRRGCFCGSAGDSWAWPERWAFGFGFFRP